MSERAMREREGMRILLELISDRRELCSESVDSLRLDGIKVESESDDFSMYLLLYIFASCARPECRFCLGHNNAYLQMHKYIV